MRDTEHLDSKALARRWNTTPAALHALRYRGTGPRAIRRGNRLLWRLADVEQWEAEHIEAPRAS